MPSHELLEFLLFGHLLAAMAWVGGGVAVQMFYLRARLAGGEILTHFAKTVDMVLKPGP